MQTNFLLSAAILIAGLGYLFALTTQNRTLQYVLKPGTMLLIIAMAVRTLVPGSLYGTLILLGLLFSLAGDIFLMLPTDRFREGLAAFLVAHLFYIAAFTRSLDFGWSDVGVIAALLMIAVPVYRRFLPALREKGGGLPVAVAAYVAVLAAMVWRALALGSGTVAVGAGLFFASDTILGWNRFVRFLPWGDYAVMSTYFTAQYFIALSVGG